MVRRCRLSGPHRPRSCGILVGCPARAIGEYSRRSTSLHIHSFPVHFSASNVEPGVPPIFLYSGVLLVAPGHDPAPGRTAFHSRKALLSPAGPP
eukprot:scaffold644_cov126-Isochrysis_galbana.AAC.1